MNESKNNNNKPFQDIEFKSLKIVFKSILIILFIVFSMLLVFSIKSQAITQDIDYTFNKDILYNSNDIPDIYNYNVRNSTFYTGNYNATYSFTDEADGTAGGTIAFVDSVSLYNGACEIVSSWQEHRKVLRLQDDATVEEDPYIRHTETQATAGTRELWVGTNDVTKNWEFSLYEGENDYIIRVRLAGSDFDYLDNGDTWQEIQGAVNDMLYHIRIIWRVDNTFDIYVDGILKVDNQATNNNQVSGPTYLQFRCYGDSEDYFYIDAYGDPTNDIDYNIGDNMIPLLEININIKEVDKFEFDFETFHSLYSIGTDNPSTWCDIENGYDHTNVNSIDSNRCIKIEGLKATRETTGIEKDFDNDDFIYNVSWSIEFTEWNNVAGAFRVFIYSNDSTLIQDIAMNQGNLYSDTTELASGFLIDLEYEFNYYINYYDNISVLTYYNEGVYQDSFIIPIMNNDGSKFGLSNIILQISGLSSEGVGNIIGHVRYIGVYNSTHSLSTELGYIQNIEMYNPLNLVWYFQKNNLFYSNIIGNYSICINEQSETLFTKYVDIISLGYRNESFFVNMYDVIYDSIYQYLQEPIIYIEIYNQVEIHNINIEGVKLTGNYDIFPSYSFVDVNISTNYFYVDNNHKLIFYVDFNESRYEGIKAIFDIPNESTTNSSFSFKGKYAGVIPSYLVIEYLGYESSYMEMKDYSTSNRYLLPQAQMTNRLIINVSDYIPFQDNYTNHNEGYISGYISDISFNYLRDIEYTLTTMTLISGFIPLIVIFTPTFALFSRFGKKIILPTMILMSIICFVGQLIPLWLFSISLIIYGYLIIIDKYESE